MSTMTSERTSFETWLEGTTGCKRCAERGQPFSLRQTVNGDYCDYRVNGRWYAWKARARLAQPAKAVDVGAIREVIDRLRINPSITAQECADSLAVALSGENAGPVDVWLPIETAPHTDHMHKVLLFWRGVGVDTGYFAIDEIFDTRRHGWPSPECGWRTDGDRCIPKNQEDCTHWMPLPTSPAPDKEGL